MANTHLYLQIRFSFMAGCFYCPFHFSLEICLFFKGALTWYGKLTLESAHASNLIILCYLIVWGMTFIFMMRLSFYAIPLLIYDVMNDITIIP